MEFVADGEITPEWIVQVGEKKSGIIKDVRSQYYKSG